MANVSPTLTDRHPVTATEELRPAVLSFRGDLDLYASHGVRNLFTTVPAGSSVIVDLNDVVFIDSSGLGALIGGLRRVREGGGKVVISVNRRPISRLLAMTGVDRLAAVAPSVKEAKAILG